MRVILTLVTVLLSSVSIAAVEDLNNLRDAQELETEHAILDFIGMGSALLSHPSDRDRYRDDERCRRYGDCRRPPSHRPGRPPGYRPGPPPHRPPPAYQYVCFTENQYREVFRGFDRSAYWAQRQATDRCYRYSRYCRELGCRYQ